MNKFGRNYKLTVELPPAADKTSNAIIITYPLSLDFDIERTTASTLNQGEFRIYNLAENTRNQLIKDRFAPISQARKVILQAGYGDQLATVFIGNLWEAYSYRVQGSPDIITYLSAQDGGWAIYNSYSQKTIQAGATFKDVFKSVAADTTLKVGEIGDIPGSFPRGVVLNGNSFQIVNKYFGGKSFVDNEVIKVVNANEVIQGDIEVISSETGLLGTPRREESFLTVETLFEPGIKPAQFISLQSTIDKRFNGQFKVIGIKHGGTISDAVCGQLKTTVQLQYGSAPLGGLTLISPSV